MTTVSVIIPTFNRLAHLRSAIESVLDQSHPVSEIIVVDDGSSDGTEQWCTPLPYLRYIKQENKGVASARNTGMRAASGEWMAFLDSDDVWEPEKIKVQLSAIADSVNSAWSITGCSVVNSGGAIQARDGWNSVFSTSHPPIELLTRTLTPGEVKHRGKKYQYFTGDLFATLFSGNIGLPSSLLLHRSVPAKVGYFNESLRLAEETEYVHRIASEFPVAVVTDPLVQYRVAQQGSLTDSSNSERLIQNALSSLDNAIQLRNSVSIEERAAYEGGRYFLAMRLAYTQLSMLRTGAVRKTLRTNVLKYRLTVPAVALYTAAFLPSYLLQGLQLLKQLMKR